MTRRSIARSTGLLLAAGLLPLANAADSQLDFAARLGAVYSDNANRTDTNKESSVAAVAGLTLLAKRPTGRWRYDASGDMSYYQYAKSGIGGQLYGGMEGKTSYDIIPGSFQWDAAASLSQIRGDLLRPSAPGNIENVVSLSTGPTLRAHFGSSFEATLTGNASTTRYSRRNFDSNGIGAKLVVANRFSDTSSLGLGASADRVSYSSQVGLGSSDFDRQEAFVSYSGASARMSIALEAGYSKFSGGSLDDTNPMFRVHATRRLTPFISAYADYSQEYPTSDENVYTAPVTTGAGGAPDNSVLTSGPKSLKNAGLGIVLSWPRTTGDIGYARRDEKAFAAAGARRTYDEAHVKVTRLLTPRSHVSAFASYTKEEASAILLDVKGNAFGAEYGLNFGSAFGVDFRVQSEDRRSPVATSRYSELSAGVFLRYGRSANPVSR